MVPPFSLRVTLGGEHAIHGAVNRCSLARAAFFGVLTLVLLWGCGADRRHYGRDGGLDGIDSGSRDAGQDGGLPGMDAGPGVDGGPGLDAGRLDAGRLDAGRLDAGRPDAGRPDAGRDAGPPTGAHLLISEIVVTPGDAELIEIFNPTGATVDLSDYYISDNSAYWRMATGVPWAPMGTADTDFVARFPAGATIAPGAVRVIAASPNYALAWSTCPDFYLSSTGTGVTCGGSSVPAMRVPANGSVGATFGSLITNSREMVILFRWSGSTAAPVFDVDYVTWGPTFGDDTRVDKTGITGYLPDTARASQVPAPAPDTAGQSVERCGVEVGERATGGNGVVGHDETSEQLGTSFRIQATPTPGRASSCP